MAADLPPTRSDARTRILQTAARLYYAEGIHAVGIERVVREADVAKATLYAHFPGKDALVASYLALESERWRTSVQGHGDSLCGRPRIKKLFDLLHQSAEDPRYRGCPFVNAGAEFPGPGPVAEQIRLHRSRVRDEFARALENEPHRATLVDALLALYGGAMTAAYIDRRPEIILHARDAAMLLLNEG
jgi:AcrR family transcriptional regulator